MDDLVAWFKLYGGSIHPSVETASDATGYHLRVRHGQSLPPGSSIVFCPRKIMINWSKVKMMLLEQNLFEQNLFREIDTHKATRLFLMLEWSKGIESFYWAYIRALPQPDELHLLNTPTYYESADEKWILGTNMHQAMTQRRAQWQQEYEWAAKEWEMLYNPKHDWAKLYIWAATILSSRAFRSPPSTVQREHPILIPVFDLANHCPSARASWVWNQSGCTLFLSDAVEGGAQIWNNYGPKSNEELILGYGFSLFRNAADQYGIATTRAVPAKLEAVASYVSRAMEIQKPGQNKPDAHRPAPIVQASDQAPDQEIHWIRLQNHIAGDYPNTIQVLRAFPPALIHKIAIVVANDREIAAFKNELAGVKKEPPDLKMNSNKNLVWTNEPHTQLTRNKLNIICHLAMLLQKYQSNIIRYDSILPPSPQNAKQIHAARYRRGQLHILTTVTAPLMNELRVRMGLDPTKPRDLRIVRLDHILLESPYALLMDFRASLKCGLGTRDASKIRRNNWVEMTFTIWVCGLWLLGGSDAPGEVEGSMSDEDYVEFHDILRRWLTFIQAAYPYTPLRLIRRSRLLTEQDSALCDESLFQTVLSYQELLGLNAAKNICSLYNTPELDTDRLAWALCVVRGEGVMVPNLEGRVGDEWDEFVLFLEM